MSGFEGLLGRYPVKREGKACISSGSEEIVKEADLEHLSDFSFSMASE